MSGYCVPYAGSISASVFTSETGEPAGRWRAASVYQPAEVIEQKPDGQQYARYEGYIGGQHLLQTLYSARHPV